jgi:signal transduction histidine kinase
VWNEAGVSIPIHISPAFWQTAWFRLLLGMALLVVLTLIVLFTVRHIRLLKAKSREESFAAMGRFASYFAHDLKSPVEGAYLIASEMGGMFPEEDERRRYLDDVVGGLKRIRGLVGEALDFSKAQNPRRIPTDLNAVIGQAVEDFRGHDGCRFDLDLDESLPPISLDGGLIRRLFVNLFENSFQASRESCVISVKSRLKKEGLVVEVADNGRGIDPDILPKIFQPFASDKDRGYGFGLAFVHETVKSHGGSIDVQSLPGAGARFEITFPPDSGGTEES